MNNVLIVSSVVYGFLMLILHIQFEKINVHYPKEVALEEKNLTRLYNNLCKEIKITVWRHFEDLVN